MPKTPADATGVPCEACGKLVRRGQFVILYDDVGEVHADCDKPYARPREPTLNEETGRPATTYVLLGEPLLLYTLLDGVSEAVEAPPGPAQPAAEAM